MNSPKLNVVKLLERQAALGEEIFVRKSEVSNIQLQLDRVEKDELNSDAKEWYSKAKYAKSMKQAELEKFETELSGVKMAIEMAGSLIADGEEPALLYQQFYKAAERRLDPDVFFDMKEEAKQIVEDMLYQSTRYGHKETL